MAGKKQRDDLLTDLLTAAGPQTLVALVIELAAREPELRRACLPFLKKQVPVSAVQQERSEGEMVRLLWQELVPTWKNWMSMAVEVTSSKIMSPICCTRSRRS